MAVLTSVSTYETHPEDAWQRIKFRPRRKAQMGVLIAVAAWREAAAPLLDEWKKNVEAKGGDADAIYDAYVKALEANDARY